MSITHNYSGVYGNIELNFTTQIISCEDTVETLEIQELVDACREAEFSTEGIAFPKICNATGKDYLDIDNGVQVGITIVLLESWVIYTERSSGVFRVTGGTLVQVSGGDPFEPNPAVTYINIQSAASTIVAISSGSGLSTAEHNQLMAIPTETLETDERTAVLETRTIVEEIQDNQVTSSGIFDTQLTEEYSVVGASPTLQQAIFEILSFLETKAVSGTTMTCKKRDGSTVAMTLTLDDATSPTSIVRTT